MSADDTPLASAAMEAADLADVRKLAETERDLYADNLGSKKYWQGYIDGLDKAVSHFQPLLAKVEGERDALQKELSSAWTDMVRIGEACGIDEKDLSPDVAVEQISELAKSYLECAASSREQREAADKRNETLVSELSALRADLAAKEAENKVINTAMERAGLLHGPEINWLIELPMSNAEYATFRSALASRADKGGATP